MERDEALLRSLAAELKARRALLGISQEELAARAEVNRTYIAKLELAQNQPTLLALLNLARAFNEDLPKLVTAIMRRYEVECDLAKNQTTKRGKR